MAFTDYQKEQIRQTIIEISSKLNFSFEYFLTPPTRSCLDNKCPGFTDELTKNNKSTQVIKQLQVLIIAVENVNETTG